jgi:hypothetical protein
VKVGIALSLLLSFLLSGNLVYLVTRKATGTANDVNDEQEQNNWH